MPQPAEAALVAAYDERVRAGEITPDPAQREIARRFDNLLGEIANHRLARKGSALGWLFAKREREPAPRGLYLHGAVGRGKTMLMDMFFEHVPAQRKRRAHFNDFMADVHGRIHAHRQKLARGETREADPVPPVASQLFAEAWVLCFDEFSVTDIADAMLLSRLFGELFKRGCVLVATSNVAPDDLYRDGLNRQLFLPFIALMKSRVEVVNLDARTDYRFEKTRLMPVFHLLGPGEGEKGLDDAWREMAAGRSVAAEAIEMKGRSVTVPRAVPDAARFSFADLCEAPLGASDYMAIAARYPTVFIDRVPRIGSGHRNAAKRFITLIDVLYDQKNRLFLSAEVPLAEIYAAGKGNEEFEFARTVSRLTEMQSADYLDASRAKGGAG